MRWGSGEQSLYAAFGDRSGSSIAWLARRYGMGECAAHFDALRSGARAINGITAMLRRVVETADQPCLGASSIYEFGASRPDLKEINALLARSLRGAVADFLIANIAGIRVAGRGGAARASRTSLAAMGRWALR